MSATNSPDPFTNTINDELVVLMFYGEFTIKQRLNGGSSIVEVMFQTHRGKLVLLRTFVFGETIHQFFK